MATDEEDRVAEEEDEEEKEEEEEEEEREEEEEEKGMGVRRRWDGRVEDAYQSCPTTTACAAGGGVKPQSSFWREGTRSWREGS